MADLDSLDIEVLVREVGDEEWKVMVCEIDDSFELTNDVSEFQSKCGTHVSVKPVTANNSGNAVFNVDPESDEVSYNDVRNWQINRTKVEMLARNKAFTSEDGTSYTAGQVMHYFYVGKFVGSNLTDATGEVGKFSWNYKPTATPIDGGASAG